VLPLWCELLPADAAANAEGVLARIAFGAPAADSLAVIDLPQLAPPLMEVWRTADAVTAGWQGSIRFAETSRVLVGTLARDARDAQAAAAHAYDELIDFARERGYPHLLRVWNHVGDVNAADGGDERYRAFCAGRYEAFARHDYALRADLPAASAVGMKGRGYQAYFIASRTPGMQVENPRQVSAYDYPPQYGRRSPSFSRATVVRDGEESLVFVAGTASIIGHETRHAGDAGAQIVETLANIDRIVAAAGGGELAMLKAYVRHEADCETVANAIRAAHGALPVMFLRADICRADLLVEVEGVAKSARRML
jgi:chorismate lyase/3-hydroxybenzoate synthase